MTISFKTGAFTSRTTTGTDVITGLGFQPKVILVFASNIFQTTDNTFGSNYDLYFGCAVDTTAANQRSFNSTDLNGQPGGNGSRCFFVNGAIGRSVGGVTAKAAISAIGTDGFTVNWTTNDGTAKRLFYICIGGTDITNTNTGTITAPTTTGNQSYTGPGFKPDFVMFWGALCKTDDTEPSGANQGASMGIGFATSSSTQTALSNASKFTAGAGTVSKHYQRSDNVISFVELDGFTPTAGALGFALVSLDTTGFTINYNTNATNGQSSKFGYLAIKGGTWVVGSASGGTAASQTVSGLGITPSGVILASGCAVSSTAIGANCRISLGGGSGSSDSRCIWAGMRDGVGTSIASSVNKSAKAISICTEASTASSTTVNAEASISALASGSFTLAWSTTGATSYEFLYVAVGGGAAANNVTKSVPAETITLGQPAPTFVKAKNVAKTASNTLTISDTGQPVKTVKHNRVRSLPAETITIGDSLTFGKSIPGHNSVLKVVPQQIITIGDSVVPTVTVGHHTVTKALTESLRISDSLTYLGKTKHTGDPGYWIPTKPRINIYQFTDTTYSSPIYSYNAFTDGTGGIDKPIGLQFESTITTAGTFMLAIDNSQDTYDPDQFSRGNRITIDCSKDNNTWSTVFHGLVRSVEQKVFGPDNRILMIEGYSYMVRLNERIIDVKKQASLVGGVLQRSDTTMFTDNLINNLLTVDTNYINTVDDTQLYSIFKTANITSSPIDDWVPRLDAQMATLNDAINSVLEFSQSLLTLDYSNDQLVLFNPDRVPTGGSNAFLVTDVPNLQGDSSANTIYPISDYTYQISYDFPDAANRLIAAIGNVMCPEQTIPGQTIPGNVGSVVYTNTATQTGSLGSAFYDVWFSTASMVMGPSASPANTRIGIRMNSGATTAIGHAVYRINLAFTKPVSASGTITVGIRKASDDSFIQYGTLDISSIPAGNGVYTGYNFDNPNSNYLLQVNDHITAETTDATLQMGISVYAGSGSTVTAEYYSGGSWNIGVLSGYLITARIYENVLDTTNYGTVQLNGSSVQRIAILIGAGSGMIGYKIGRISLSLRTNGTAPNGLYWVGIRKVDNTFVYFGAPSTFDTTTFHPQDSTFRDYFYDNLNNNYPLAVGDRISIEVSGMTTGYLEMEATKNGGTPHLVQVWNGTSYVTTGVTNFKLAAEISTTTASQTPDITIDPCGGPPETADADAIFQVVTDRNSAKRVGQVEQVISNLPPHVKNITTLNEWMFNKIYVMAKPRFTFDYQNVTLPAILPKAGDICVHVSQKAGIGVRRNPVQTGVISQVSYEFGQDNDSILGLRRIALQTTGIVRGSY